MLIAPPSIRFANCLLLAVCLGLAQTAENQLAFEAASVKPSAPSAGGRNGMVFSRTMGGPGTKDPGRIRYSSMSLKAILLIAWHVDDFQIAGPAWLETERFDIDATMPPNTTPERFRGMLQNLLLKRFKLALHRETKEVPGYALIPARNGPKLAESVRVPAAQNAGAPDSPAGPVAPPSPAGPVAPPQFKLDRDGFPILPPGAGAGLLQFVVAHRARLVGQQQTMRELADRLAYLLSRPVTDATTLTGKYDFTLTFAAEGTALGRGPSAVPPPPPGGDAAVAGAAEAETPPDIFTAVQSQLGLRLEPKKGSVEMIVIDHIDRTPVEN
jgi:uncharacterized protein (TIGR03435 family)